jgi:hypothetical protein
LQALLSLLRRNNDFFKLSLDAGGWQQKRCEDGRG